MTTTKDPKKIYIDKHIWMPRDALSPPRLNILRGGLRVLDGAGDFPLYHEDKSFPWILLPRCKRVFADVYEPEVVDLRPGPQDYEHVPFQKNIQLDHREGVPTGLDVQRRAHAAIRDQSGVLQLYCGAGKTAVALHLMAEQQAPFVVVADNVELLEQWAASIHRFLGVRMQDLLPSKTSVDKYATSPVVLTTYQALARTYNTKSADFEKVQRRFRTVIFDEAHHLNARTFSACAEAFSGHRLSLTATPKRADGLHVIQESHVGGVLFQELRAPLKAKVKFVRTPAVLPPQAFDWTKLNTGERQEDRQNAKVAGLMGALPERKEAARLLAKNALDTGRKILILSSSVTALAHVAAAIAGVEGPVNDENRASVLLKALEARKDLGVMTSEVSSSLRRKGARCMLAILRYGREGYDDASLDTVLLLEPVASQAMLQQILGRTERIFPGKKEPVVFVLQDKEPVFERRCDVMRKIFREWPEEAGGQVEYSWLLPLSRRHF